MRSDNNRPVKGSFASDCDLARAFECLFENADDAFFILNNSGTIVASNPRAEKLTRTKRQDLVGKPFKEIVQLEILPHSVRGPNRIAKRKPTTVEMEFKTAVGEAVTLEVNLIPCMHNGKTMGTLGLVRDITERRRIENALRESEERYRNLLEAAPEAIYTVSKDGIITSLNPSFETITGWQTSEWVGKSFTGLVHPEDLPLATETFQKTLLGETVPTYELRILSKSGRYLVGEFTSKPQINKGKIVGEFGVVRDVTEHNRSEEALRCSETKYRALFERIPDGVYQSSPEGKIITANLALVHMLGYDTLAELLALDVARDIYPDPEDRRIWQKELDTKGELRNAELVLKRKDGKMLTVLENAHMVRDPKSEFTYYEGTITDITDRKELEDKLSALNSYSGKLNVAKNPRQIYELALDAIEKMLGFENAAFMIAEKGELHVVSQRGSPETCLQLPLDGSKKGLTVKAANTCKPVLVNDVKEDVDYAEANPNIRSELAIPVEIEGKTLGVLDVENKKVGAFDDRDAMLLQILASHIATAISNLEKRSELEKRSNQLASLMRHAAEMIRPMDLPKRLETMAKAIGDHGWRRVVIRAVKDENMELASPEDLVTVGLAEEEKKFLWENRMPGQIWRERFGTEFERFKLGKFYHLPWSDPWVRKRFAEGTVPSKLSAEDMVDWDPEDLLYAPLRLADGRIVGILSIDDPVDGKRPTQESLAPLELFIYQAAVTIENAQLIQQVNEAKNQLEEYADRLELKVKERTKELVEVQNKLLKSERLVAIGEVAAMVGHDLRNPLTSIAGATYYLKTKAVHRSDKKLKQMLRIIEKDIQYSNKIVNDLLDYSREMHLDPTESTLKSLVDEALSMVKIPNNVKVSDSTLKTPIKIDIQKMKRVLVNIIKNAVDAMPKGGTLTISSKETCGGAELVFSDTGIGMSEEILDRIWSPLFTTKARGMGFGLAICKRIVEAHGGSITAESCVGKGTTFIIKVPTAPKIDGGGTIWVNVPESLLSTMMKA